MATDAKHGAGTVASTGRQETTLSARDQPERVGRAITTPLDHLRKEPDT